MIPIRVRLRGFLSYREEEVLDFDGQPLWMLGGPNGAGKSSIFDAIKFALFGSHRGGGQQARQLINRNADNLEVEFDFAAGGHRFRVHRTVGRRGNSTRQAYQLTEDSSDWKAVPVPGTEGKSRFDAWVRETLGMTESTFTASILLEQGKSDVLITADPSDRFKMLEQLVDLSAYERLYRRADKKATETRGLANGFKADLERMGKTDEAEIQRLHDEEKRLTSAIKEAEEAVAQADRRLQELAGLKVHAARWETLDRERERLATEAETARHLLDRAAEIERRAARQLDLAGVLPIIEGLRKEQVRLAKGAEAIGDKEAAAAAQVPVLAERYGVDPATATLTSLLQPLEADVTSLEELQTALPWLRLYAEARDAWRQAMEDETSWATEEKRLGEELATCLEGRAAAETKTAAAAEHAQQTRDAWTSAQTEHKAAKERLQRFQKVESKPTCDYCGQDLTEAHLEQERTRLHQELRRTVQTEKEAKTAYDNATALQASADEMAGTLKSEETRLRNTLRETAIHLQALRKKQAEELKRAVESLAELPERLARKLRPTPSTDVAECLLLPYPTCEELMALRTEAADVAERRRELVSARQLLQALKEEQDRHAEITKSVTNWQVQLPAAWQHVGQTLTDELLLQFQQEKRELKGAAEELLQLQEARRDQKARETRLGKIAVEVDGLPDGAHRPSAELEAEEKSVSESRSESQRLVVDLGASRRDVVTRRERITELHTRWNAEDQRAGFYEVLSRLLHRDNLQTHLLRQAEGGIIHYANEVLESLSRGTLRLEARADTEADPLAAQKALDVVVHNGEIGGDPLPIAFLSGSQKFRVAVSLALGIGRYASLDGQRVQSVIIDEGFGSLDKDGRYDMIAELRALSGTLERIIVVSHQEELGGCVREPIRHPAK